MKQGPFFSNPYGEHAEPTYRETAVVTLVPSHHNATLAFIIFFVEYLCTLL